MGTKETLKIKETIEYVLKSGSNKSSFNSSNTTNNISIKTWMNYSEAPNYQNELDISSSNNDDEAFSVSELDLNIKGELLKYKNNLNNFKSNFRKKQYGSLTDLQRKNSYSLSKNTLTLIENEIDMDELMIDFNDYDIDLNIDIKKNSSSNYPNEKINNLSHYKKSASFQFGNNSSHILLDEPIQKSSRFINIQKNNDYFLNFENRKCDEIRRSYISKLIYSGILAPNNEKNSYSHNSIIIFDWDDTLLCTSFLTPNGIFDENVELTAEEKEKMSGLENQVYNLLNTSIKKGDTYIITNSQPGWVEYSANKFYPSLNELLTKITIISARGEYEKQYPGNSRIWKIKAFIDMIENIDCSLVTNIVCVGDSFIEIEAAKALASQFNQAFIKCVKFREVPKIEELDKQLVLFNENFEKIFAQVKNLNIYVEKKNKEL